LVRLANTDRIHAQGAWDPSYNGATAQYGVFQGKPYVAVGVPPYSDDLNTLGFTNTPTKKMSARYYIIEDEDVVALAQKALGIENTVTT
jgi:hypothetical protein